MGIWSALTIQGKLAVLAAVIGGLFLIGLAYGGGNTDTSSLPNTLGTRPLGSQVPLQVVDSATATPTTSASAVAAATSNALDTDETPTPEPQTEIAEADTPTTEPVVEIEPPTSTPEPLPTAVPVEPTATATPTPACSVTSLTVFGTDTVSAQLTCEGGLDSVVQMLAFFDFEETVVSCGGATNAGGFAACSIVVDNIETGDLNTVGVCFTYHEEQICSTSEEF